MKQFFLSILLVTCILPALALADEVDLRINGVGLGTSEIDVLRKFGKPLQSKKGEFNDCGSGYEKALRYSGLEIKLLSDDKGRNFTVIAMEVTSSKWLVSGVKVDAGPKDVQAKFGASLETREEAGLQSWFYVNKGNDGFAGFYLKGDKLVKMLWESALC